MTAVKKANRAAATSEARGLGERVMSKEAKGGRTLCASGLGKMERREAAEVASFADSNATHIAAETSIRTIDMTAAA
jgi:hypothetical protein